MVDWKNNPITEPSPDFHELVWGEDGLDPKNILCYFAYRITDDSTYKGAYAFSFVTGRGRVLNV